MNIEVEHRGDGIIVCRPTGELDSFTGSRLRQALAELGSRPRLVIDLSPVTFIDSAGLRAVIGAIRWIRELGGAVAVACNRPTMLRLLRRTGMDRVVAVAATIEEAVEALEPRAGDDRIA